MLKKLNENEIENFIERYSSYLKEDVQDVNCLETFGLKTFLINGHFLIADNNGKIKTTDFFLV